MIKQNFFRFLNVRTSAVGKAYIPGEKLHPFHNLRLSGSESQGQGWGISVAGVGVGMNQSGRFKALQSVNTELYTNVGTVIRVRTSRKKKRKLPFHFSTMYKATENEVDVIADKIKG